MADAPRRASLLLRTSGARARSRVAGLRLPVLPLLVTSLIFGGFALAVPGYLSPANLQQLLRDFAELGLVTLGMSVVVLAGGIDLSLGATFAIADLAALAVFQIEGLSALAALSAALAAGLLIGSANGFLVAYAGTRPFLTTLATLLVLRAGYVWVANALTVPLADAAQAGPVWDFLGAGTLLGVPCNMAVLAALALVAHGFLTRTRPGLHLTAIGSSRLAARAAGVDIRATLWLAYVLGACSAALAGFLYAARQNSAGSDTGQGWELSALAAIALGGGDLTGGRVGIARSLIGAGSLFLLRSGLLRLNAPGSAGAAVTGLALLAAVALTANGGKRGWTRPRPAEDSGDGS